MIIQQYDPTYKVLLNYSQRSYQKIIQKIIDFTDKTLPAPIANVCYQFMTTLPLILCVVITPPKLVLSCFCIALFTNSLRYNRRVRDKAIVVISNSCFIKATAKAFTVIRSGTISVLAYAVIYVTIGSIGQLLLTKYK